MFIFTLPPPEVGQIGRPVPSLGWQCGRDGYMTAGHAESQVITVGVPACPEVNMNLLKINKGIQAHITCQYHCTVVSHIEPAT